MVKSVFSRQKVQVGSRQVLRSCSTFTTYSRTIKLGHEIVNVVQFGRLPELVVAEFVRFRFLMECFSFLCLFLFLPLLFIFGFVVAVAQEVIHSGRRSCADVATRRHSIEEVFLV